MLSREAVASPFPYSICIPDCFCQSAWIEPAPFAFWLTDALRPARFVELGRRHPYSCFDSCQGISGLLPAAATRRR